MASGEPPRKTVLVSLGKRTREITFQSGSDSECEGDSEGPGDLYFLKKAIRQEFADCLSSPRDLVVQVFFLPVCPFCV